MADSPTENENLSYEEQRRRWEAAEQRAVEEMAQEEREKEAVLAAEARVESPKPLHILIPELIDAIKLLNSSVSRLAIICGMKLEVHRRFGPPPSERSLDDLERHWLEQPTDQFMRNLVRTPGRTPSNGAHSDLDSNDLPEELSPRDRSRSPRPASRRMPNLMLAAKDQREREEEKEETTKAEDD